MTAALRYSPPGEGHEIGVVRSYYFGAGAQWSFFNPNLPSDCVVHKTRELVHQQIIREAGTASPERLLQLVSLLLTSEPNGCNIDQSPEFKKYEKLAKVILDNVDEWQHLTKLDAEEIISYLKLACPTEHAPLEQIEVFERCARSESCQSQWQAVPSADALIDAMEALSGGCELDAKERQNAEQLGHMAVAVHVPQCRALEPRADAAH